MSLRGFENNGVGPRSYIDNIEKIKNKMNNNNNVQNSVDLNSLGDSLGGDSKSSLLVSLSVPVPIQILAQNKARAFLFLNLGSLGHLYDWRKALILRSNGDKSSVINTEKNPFFGYTRCSIGGGLSFLVAQQLRLELTYSIPILKSIQDNCKNFQLGISLNIN
jgi:outer membrane protein assembly factor BamA